MGSGSLSSRCIGGLTAEAVGASPLIGFDFSLKNVAVIVDLDLGCFPKSDCLGQLASSIVFDDAAFPPVDGDLLDFHFFYEASNRHVLGVHSISQAGMAGRGTDLNDLREIRAAGKSDGH